MVRLILLSLLLLVSLLGIFRAPTYRLWHTAILVTEFPWIFILVTIGLLLLGIKYQNYLHAGTLLGIVALVIFMLPVVRAYVISSRLDKDLNAAFGPVTTKDKNSGLAFNAMQMITGIGATQLPYYSIIYDKGGLTLDFYKAQKQGKQPCVIVVHGGSWAGGDSRQLPELNTVLATKGYNVASINYRLAPEHKSPAAVADLKVAIEYLKLHADELQIDTDRFVLLGRSAGAQITLVAAYTFHDSAIKGTISFYGPADMVWGYSLPANLLVFDSRKVMVDYLGGTYKEVPQQYYNSSAIEFVTNDAPPTLMIHGPLDPLVAYEHSIRLSARLNQNKIPHYVLSLPWGTHACDYTLNGPGGQLSTYSVLHFLRSVCK